MAEEYREHFGEHAFDDEGNYIWAADDAERESAWSEYFEELGDEAPPVRLADDLAPVEAEAAPEPEA